QAARINNAGLIAECVNLRYENGKVIARCPSWGGEIMADITFSNESDTGFLTVQAHGLKEVEAKGEPGDIEWIPLETVVVPEGLTFISMESEPVESQKLEEAKVVVVGGAGLGNSADFGRAKELAAAMGGELGATRPPVLQHWIEEDRMIGQTGKTVRPDVLLSIGTSGAIQYTAGIMESKTIVAVNRDRKSPIFEVADLGIVADAKTFVPLLTAKVKQVAMRKLTDAMYRGESVEKGNGFG
ncbi:MAG: electron transfer flavoprotein subunit alpha/FixB family protein, partial [Deltaproteobacteria bacterium]|nr:electron transfer flavoprotein subunit alpha/FixB family protein [Deltaproteobacteria bacterium]